MSDNPPFSIHNGRVHCTFGDCEYVSEFEVNTPLEAVEMWQLHDAVKGHTPEGAAIRIRAEEASARQAAATPASDLAESMAQVAEVAAILIETAGGLRAKMEAEGWSPTAAEGCAGAWLATGMTTMWGQAR
jgi:hypothetical protein